MDQGYAFFVNRAPRVEKLKRLHLLKKEVPFIVEKNITLRKEDYENFVSDLGVERQFIDDNKGLCRIEKGIYHSIFVRRWGKKDGILVMSDRSDRPLFAAYYDFDADRETAADAAGTSDAAQMAERQYRMI
jgi:hypothetical protein